MVYSQGINHTQPCHTRKQRLQNLTQRLAFGRSEQGARRIGEGGRIGVMRVLWSLLLPQGVSTKEVAGWGTDCVEVSVGSQVLGKKRDLVEGRWGKGVDGAALFWRGREECRAPKNQMNTYLRRSKRGREVDVVHKRRRRPWLLSH